MSSNLCTLDMAQLAYSVTSYSMMVGVKVGDVTANSMSFERYLHAIDIPDFKTTHLHSIITL